MRTHMSERSSKMAGSLDLVDITEDVRDVVKSSEISAGQVVVTSPCADCNLIVNERESGLFTDLRRAIEQLGGGKAARGLVGSASVVLPVVEGDLRVGTWQRVLL